MDIVYTKPLTKNSYNILRTAGYVPIREHKSGKESYVFKISGDRYPRLHLYVDSEEDDKIKWHLHLDNKEHGWGDRRHDTEYDGEQVEEEAARLRRWLAHFTKKTSDQPPPEQFKKREAAGNFIAKLLG